MEFKVWDSKQREIDGWKGPTILGITGFLPGDRDTCRDVNDFYSQPRCFSLGSMTFFVRSPVEVLIHAVALAVEIAALLWLQAEFKLATLLRLVNYAAHVVLHLLPEFWPDTGKPISGGFVDMEAFTSLWLPTF